MKGHRQSGGHWNAALDLAAGSSDRLDSSACCPGSGEGSAKGILFIIRDILQEKRGGAAISCLRHQRNGGRWGRKAAAVPSHPSTRLNYNWLGFSSVQYCTLWRALKSGGNRNWFVPSLLSLVPAGMVLRRHQNQARSCFRRPQLLLRRSAASLQDPNDSRISREYANSNGEHHREAENQRHE